MIIDFFKKQKTVSDRKQTIKSMVLTLRIPDMQKSLYLEALDVIDEKGLEILYVNISQFMKEIEDQKISDIKKDNFSFVAGMKKEEVEEKQKEINSFSFLINNL